MNLARFQTLFPLGSHLCREPMPPMPELKHDMEVLKRQGFNLVKLQENWAYDEPVEGWIDLSKYEELIEHAAHLDLGVYLGLTCEQAPAWLWRKHPGCRMVGRNGLPVAYEAQMTLPADGKPGPCYDDPGAIADHLRFIRKLVEVLGRFENVVVWNTWQEIAYWSEHLTGQHVCYCKHTLEAFRRWLAGKYGDLDGLNRAWNTRYGDWNSVQPDRAASGRECLPQDIDWRFFMDNEHPAATLRARAETIRQADPLRGRPVFAHLGGPVIGSGRHWTYARCQDFLGSSCYPAWSPHHPWDDAAKIPLASRSQQRQESLAAEMSFVALTYDQIRSCNLLGRPVWAAEFQGGPVSTGFHKGRTPDPGDIRRWMLTAIASGVTAISFWVTRAEIAAAEMHGFSLLDSEGDESARLAEAGRIGRALNQHADLFSAPTLQRSKIAILVNEANYQVCASMNAAVEHLGYSTRGWHRLLWELGFPVDFLEVKELEEVYAQEYKVLILPFPLSLSEEVMQKLARFVETGGCLVSEAAPGRLSEHAYANRGEMSLGARQLFGVKQTGFQMVREPDSGERWSPPERTWGEYLEAAALEGNGIMAGHRLRANAYIETFQPSDSQVFLAYGDAATGCVRNFGKGKAWLLGTYVGHNGNAYRDPESWAFIHRLLAECGVRPSHPGRLLLRKRTSPGKEAWIFTNPTGAELVETIDASGWNSVSDLLGEAVERNGNAVRLAIKGLDVRVLILERQP